jgi:hypothetical protein
MKLDAVTNTTTNYTALIGEIIITSSDKYTGSINTPTVGIIDRLYLSKHVTYSTIVL